MAKRKFYEGLDALKALIADSGIKGGWADNNGGHQFKSQRGGVLGYWETTHTVNVQGQSPGKEELEALLDAAEKGAAVAIASALNNPEHIDIM